jgi:hypothetical protein
MVNEIVPFRHGLTVRLAMEDDCAGITRVAQA